MGKSSGARPTKAVAEEVAVLRAQLGTLTSSEWQKAYLVYGMITDLCEHRGPMGKANPRACGYCGFFGHTREFCKRREEHARLNEERETRNMRTEHDEIVASLAEHRLKNPKRARELEDLNMRYDRAMNEGGCKGCLRAEGEEWPCNECEECVKFRLWFDKP